MLFGCGCSPNGHDRVGGGAELVVRHVGHRYGVTGCTSRLLRCAGRLSGGVMCGTSGDARLSYGDLAARPSTRLFDRPSRTVVPWARFLEEVKHVLGAVGRPYREKTMIGVLKPATSTHSDEPGISAPTIGYGCAHAPLDALAR